MTYQELIKQAIDLKNKEQYEEAVKVFSEAIALDDSQPEGYFYRANVYNHSLKQFRLALKDYTQAITLKCDNEFYYYNRALCYLNLSEVDKALDDYTAALTINPNYALAIWDKALIESDKENFEEALKGLKRVLALSPHSAAIVYKDVFNI